MDDVSKAQKYIQSLKTENKPDAEPLIIDCDPGIDDAMALLLLSDNLDKFDQIEDLTRRSHEEVCKLAGIDPKENIYEPIYNDSKKINYY